MTSGPDPGELPGFWGSMVFRHAPIPRKGSGKQQQQQQVLGKDAASALSKISFSNDTITRRQDDMASFVESKIVEILRKTKFSFQTDESTINNQAILLVYVRFIHDDDVREEMLLITSLPKLLVEKIFSII